MSKIVIAQCLAPSQYNMVFPHASENSTISAHYTTFAVGHGPKGLELSSDHETSEPPTGLGSSIKWQKKWQNVLHLHRLKKVLNWRAWKLCSEGLFCVYEPATDQLSDIMLWPPVNIYTRGMKTAGLLSSETAGVIGWDGDMLTIYGLPLAFLVRWYRRVLPSISISKVLGDGCWYQFWCNWAWWIIVGQIIPRWPYPHENATFYQWVYHCLNWRTPKCLVWFKKTCLMMSIPQSTRITGHFDLYKNLYPFSSYPMKYPHQKRCGLLVNQQFAGDHHVNSC